MFRFAMRPATTLSGVTIFLAAFLLFLVEPMAAKQLLPALGGSAAVWTTCLVFFQVALLAGYAYAYLLASIPRRAFAIHTATLCLALLILLWKPSPIGGEATAHPFLSIFGLLSRRIGLPFLALASTSPLLQAWYVTRNAMRAEAKPPWHLFAISNFASVLALVAYPALVEPGYTLRVQQITWTAAFVVFAVLSAGCAVLVRRPASRDKGTSGVTFDNPQIAEAEVASADNSNARDRERPSLLHVILWVLLPACGSYLLCAVTNHISQNIAAIPLLWILPLLAYLLSFIVTFSSPAAYPVFVGTVVNALAVGIVSYILYNTRVAYALQISVPIFLGCLFLMCFFCHGELYRIRPAARHATAFYLLVALGSAAGGLYVGVVAPSLFVADYDLIFGVMFLCLLAVVVTWDRGLMGRLFWAGAAATTIWVAFVQVRDARQDALVQVRSFYGSLRVTQTHWPPEAGTTRILYHGTIEHGSQLFGGNLRKTPTTYYAFNSGVGLALRFCCGDRASNVAIVGLGTGTLAAYGDPGDSFTFFEIDPNVKRLADAFFTYLRESQAQVRVVPGDARVSLAREEAAGNVPRYDVIVLDAFSGDAVPVHLLTAEAIDLYRQRLKPTGVLAFHVSSQYLSLGPLLAVQAAEAGMQAVMVHSEQNDAVGEFSSDWVLMTANPDFLKQPEVFNSSLPLLRKPGLKPWTDDFNSLLPILRFDKTRVARPTPPGD